VRENYRWLRLSSHSQLTHKDGGCISLSHTQTHTHTHTHTQTHTQSIMKLHENAGKQAVQDVEVEV